MRQTIRAAALAATACAAATVPAAAEIKRQEADAPVLTVAQRLETAVATAGATIFARVDHAEGAASVDMDLSPSVLLIFGNPRLGTAAMQDDPLAGLALPLRMLVYEDDQGTVWVAYEEVDSLFDDLGISEDAPYLETMREVMETFATTAATGS